MGSKITPLLKQYVKYVRVWVVWVGGCGCGCGCGCGTMAGQRWLMDPSVSPGMAASAPCTLPQPRLSTGWKTQACPGLLFATVMQHDSCCVGGLSLSVLVVPAPVAGPLSNGRSTSPVCCPLVMRRSREIWWCRACSTSMPRESISLTKLPLSFEHRNTRGEFFVRVFVVHSPVIMGMYHSTSGKRGFGPYEVETCVSFTDAQAKAVLQEEDRLRASPVTQARFVVCLSPASSHSTTPVLWPELAEVAQTCSHAPCMYA